MSACYSYSLPEARRRLKELVNFLIQVSDLSWIWNSEDQCAGWRDESKCEVLYLAVDQHPKFRRLYRVACYCGEEEVPLPFLS